MNSEQQIIDGEYFADNAQFIHRSLFYNSPFMFSIVLCINYLFLNSNGVIPTYRLKYLPKKEALGKFREFAISWIVILVPFSLALASIMTIYAIVSNTLLPVTCLTVVLKC